MNIWDVIDVVAIVIIGIVLLDLVLLSIYIICNSIRRKQKKKEDKINIIDDNANEIVAIVQELREEDKIRVILVWDKGRVEIKGRRGMEGVDW